MNRFQQFSKEKQYLLGVSPATVSWYETSLAWLPNENPNSEDLKALVIRMREKGLKATGINSVCRAINSYLHWNSGVGERKCSPACSHPRVSKLKEPQMVLPSFSTDQIKKLVIWKPRTKNQRRLHLLVLFMLDTGCRISEILNLHTRNLDLDNLLVTLDGKGNKQRKVPFSFELRKLLYKYISDYGRRPDLLLFATRTEVKLDRRDMLRDVKNLCRDLGFEPPVRTLHCFRHTFAVNYIRKGGSVFHLQKALGHTSLDMTRKYANLATEDLQAVHQKLSLLGGI